MQNLIVFNVIYSDGSCEMMNLVGINVTNICFYKHIFI